MSETTSQTKVENGHTVIIGKKSPDINGHTETKKGKTGRPKRKTPAPITWSIRNVEPDTRAVIEKAAERANKTLGEFFNTELREAAQNLIKKASTPPASPEDVKQMVQAQLSQFETVLQERLDKDHANILEAIRNTKSIGLVERIRQTLFGVKS